MDAKLKERAQTIAAYTRNERRKAGALPEIKEVYTLLTGQTVVCTFCNVDELVNRISQQLIQEPLTVKNMSTAKFQFKHNAASKQVIRHNQKTGITTVITPENINEGDNAAYLAKHNPHLVEETKASKAAAEESEPAKSAPAKTETKTTTTPAKK